MRKFMKYEIRGTYKFILGILLIIMLASGIIQYNIYNEIKAFDYNQINQSMNLLRFMFILSIFVIVGASITAFFYIVSSFRKELYEDRGYLTFVLPLTGNQILGSKLLVAVMWNAIIALVTGLFNLILAAILFKDQAREILLELVRSIDLGFVTTMFMGLISGLITLIIVYFAISLSRVSIRNKKIGGMWFIIFLILSGVTSYISSKVGYALPYFLDINTLKIVGIDAARSITSGMMEVTLGMGSSMIDGVFPGFINIGTLITNILFGIAFFMGTGYLIENRIEI